MSYDLLLKLAAPSLFTQKLSNSAGLLEEELPNFTVFGKNTGPSFSDLPGTTLKIRFGPVDAEVSTTFEGDTAAEAVAEINANAGTELAFVTVDHKVCISDPYGQNIEVMIGNSVLGLYEQRDMPALLKIIGPTLDTIRSEAKAIYDIMDIDAAPDDFAKEIGKLLNYKWKANKDSDKQKKMIKLLPFIYRFKGTIPSIQTIVRLNGGEAEVFEPYRYISRYDDDELDGEFVFNTPGTRSLSGGETDTDIDGFTILRDTINSPFIEEDEHRYIFIPSLPGPIQGFKIGKVISSSEVEIPSATTIVGYEDLFYQIVDPPRIFDRLESRSYWHEGVYEVIANIPTEDYKQDIKDIVHPAGRRVIFRFQPDIPVVEADDTDLFFEVKKIIDLMIPFGDLCGMSWDEQGELDVDGDTDADGCQILFGFDVKTIFGIYACARHDLSWSEVLHWEDVSGKPLYFTDLRSAGQTNHVSLLPEGHVWGDGYTDIQPNPHIVISGYSGIINFDGETTMSLIGILPEGSEVLIVNEGGTPNHATDNFTGGTTYTPVTEWEQDGSDLNLIGIPVGPDSPQVRVFYTYNPYELVDWS